MGVANASQRVARLGIQRQPSGQCVLRLLGTPASRCFRPDAAAAGGYQLAGHAARPTAALPSDDSLQIFNYNDFPGTSGLELASKSEASSLSDFIITRIRQPWRMKRLIMTTREQYINETADGPADPLAEIARQPRPVRANDWCLRSPSTIG